LETNPCRQSFKLKQQLCLKDQVLHNHDGFSLPVIVYCSFSRQRFALYRGGGTQGCIGWHEISAAGREIEYYNSGEINVKKMLRYEEAGVVRNGMLEEGGVGVGKVENMEIIVISPDETGNSGYEFIKHKILVTSRRRDSIRVSFCVIVPGWEEPQRLERGASLVCAVIGAVCRHVNPYYQEQVLYQNYPIYDPSKPFVICSLEHLQPRFCGGPCTTTSNRSCCIIAEGKTRCFLSNSDLRPAPMKQPLLTFPQTCSSSSRPSKASPRYLRSPKPESVVATLETTLRGRQVDPRN